MSLNAITYRFNESLELI